MTSTLRIAAKLAPASRFWSRVAGVSASACALLAAMWALGAVCYHWIADLDWLPAIHQAALLLAGMGPVETKLNDWGRVFESLYAIACGVVLIFATGLLLTPVIHRILHRFHIEDAGSGD